MPFSIEAWSFSCLFLSFYSYFVENSAFGCELSSQSEGCVSSKSTGPPAYPGAGYLSEVRV